MIKIFRKIRYDLMEKNKTGKYLKYAIGEIILVVIGILIALSINNWNENRKNRKKEKVYITNIQRDLKAQLVILDRATKGELLSYANLSNALKSFHQHNGFVVNTESLSEISAVNDRFTFNIIDTALDEIKSSGNLDIIQKNEVKDSLLKYYNKLRLSGQIIASNNLQNDNSAMAKSLALTSVMGDDTDAFVNFDAGIADTFKKVPDNIIQLVSKSINIPENSLILYNLINYKRGVSYFHISLYKKTEKNIYELNKLLLENYSFLE
ncbi:hypothetical protein HSX10_16135 [Winogradskyella undariae]|uniref:DUF6090 family protein n=1 Tax=Winogradskyella undariae TaxID=1285465 RepID=UPI00156BD57F|nr:DUF6090 family protein [Winogradskyella undariae]NRR93106.1 hypothetical protein [Winogradskyella undariae]